MGVGGEGGRGNGEKQKGVESLQKQALPPPAHCYSSVLFCSLFVCKILFYPPYKKKKNNSSFAIKTNNFAQTRGFALGCVPCIIQSIS